MVLVFLGEKVEQLQELSEALLEPNAVSFNAAVAACWGAQRAQIWRKPHNLQETSGNEDLPREKHRGSLHFFRMVETPLELSGFGWSLTNSI